MSVRLLPSPWAIPTSVRVDGDRITWSKKRGRLVPTFGSATELMALADAFVLIGRHTPPRARTRGHDRAEAFVATWGPWGACDYPDHVHGPLAGRGAPARSFPPPPGHRAGDSISAMISSARTLNALRAVTALAKVATDGEAVDATAARLAVPMLDSVLGPLQVEPYIERTAAFEVVDGWIKAWWAAAHVGPPSPPSSPGSYALISVGGVCGALAVALWLERALPVRTALCQDCGITWRPGRDWTEGLLIGENRRCGLCRNAMRQRRYRR
jgi:hypothetical protein